MALIFEGETIPQIAKSENKKLTGSLHSGFIKKTKPEFFNIPALFPTKSSRI